MDESILETIKKLLGAENLSEFDNDIIIFINGSLNTLIQNGVGPKTGFSVKNGDETWKDFFQDKNEELFELCKEFVYLKVKLIWDSNNLTSTVLEYMKQQALEDLWRINQQADPADFFEVDDDE